MADTDYKVKRKITIFAVIMGILLFISILSFFEIINFGDYFVDDYCEVPKRFSCESLKIESQSISFVLVNAGDELENLEVIAEAGGCEPFIQGTVGINSRIRVTIPCAKTADRGKTFKTHLLFKYKGAMKLKGIEAEGKVKSMVRGKL